MSEEFGETSSLQKRQVKSGGRLLDIGAPGRNDALTGLRLFPRFFLFVGEVFPGEHSQAAELGVLDFITLLQGSGENDYFVFRIDNSEKFHAVSIAGNCQIFFAFRVGVRVFIG